MFLDKLIESEGMIEPFRLLQDSDFRLLTCTSGTFNMFAKFFKRLMQASLMEMKLKLQFLLSTFYVKWKFFFYINIFGKCQYVASNIEHPTT